MCIWGLSALGSVQSLSLSNHTPSSWSSRRMFCACMCTSNLVFRPQKVSLWYSQPDHILWYFPDDQSILIQCRQNLNQLLLMLSLWVESVWDYCLLEKGREYYLGSEFLARVCTEESVANCVRGSIHNSASEQREMWRTYSHRNEESLEFCRTERPPLNLLRSTQSSYCFLSGHLSEVQWISSELVMYPCACSTYRDARSSSSTDGFETYTRWCLHNAGSKRVSVSICVSSSVLHLLLKYFLWWALCSIKWSSVLNTEGSCVK